MICPHCGSIEGVVEQTRDDETPFVCLDCVHQFKDVPRWAFTFGMGYNLRNRYVVVAADDRDDAVRRFMAARALAGHDPKLWAFDYPFDDNFAKQIQQYGLTPIDISAPIHRAP